MLSPAGARGHTRLPAKHLQPPGLAGRSGDMPMRDFCREKSKSSPAHVHVSACPPCHRASLLPPGVGERSPSLGRGSYQGPKKVGVKPFCSLAHFSKQLS